jgi:hypothetical protein
MMKCKTVISILTLTGFPLASAVSQALAPSTVFEEKTTTRAENGTAQPVRVSVQSWAFGGRENAAPEIPLRGFYVAHLLSGHVSASIDGQARDHWPGDYWVTANSHKVIRNLIDETIKAADRLEIELQCCQKPKEVEAPQRHLSFAKSNDDLLATLRSGAEVGGGTAWLWSEPDAFEAVDALFVEEAAQMSLAE